jgi:hypothetical protein
MASESVNGLIVAYRDAKEALFGPVSPYKMAGKNKDEIALYLDDDLKRRILEVPEPWDWEKRSDVNAKAIAYKEEADALDYQIKLLGKDFNNPSQEDIVNTVAEVDLARYVMYFLGDAKANSEYGLSLRSQLRHVLNDAEPFKIKYIKLAIEMMPEIKKSHNGNLEWYSYQISKNLYEQLMEKNFGEEYWELKSEELYDQIMSKNLILQISEMKNPTVNSVVKACLDAYEPYRKLEMQKRREISFNCQYVQDAAHSVGINGKVTEALQETKWRQLDNFERENKPYIEKHDLGRMESFLRYEAKDIRKEFSSRRSALEGKLKELEAEKAKTHKIRVMDLNTNAGNDNQAFKFELDKIYCYVDDTAFFEGRATHKTFSPKATETLNYYSEPKKLDWVSLEEELTLAKDAYNDWAKNRCLRGAK